MAKAEARVRDTSVRCGRANLSASTLIPVRTGSSGWPLVPMAGPLRWAVDSAGGTKPANPSGPGFLRGASPGRVLFLCWCGRSGGAPASASASMTAMDGPLARLTIERHPALGSAGQHASVDVRGLGTLLSFSVHSFPIGWLLELLTRSTQSCLFRYLCVFRD